MGETVGVAALALAIATALVALLEGSLGIANASPIYLLTVVVVGSRSGTLAAIGTTLVAFVLYDVVFTEPQWSLVVADPEEWLDLLVFLLVAVAIGRLAATERARTIEADRRASEAGSLFAISRVLSTSPSFAAAAPEVAQRLIDDAVLTRVWITVDERGGESLMTDTSDGATIAAPSVVTSLVRTPGDEPARWTRTHRSQTTRAPGHREAHGDVTEAVLRVPMEVGPDRLGSIWALRPRADGLPTREQTRVLALAADQLALAIRRERLRREATAAEVARQADSLKSSLLDAVSHDLRTPLASIRALAGGLADPAEPWTDDERRATAIRIDEEAARLDRLVRQVLDLGRIGAGSVEPELEPLDLVAVVGAVLDRLRASLAERPVTVGLPDELLVLADAALLETVVTNVLENVARHAPAPAPLRISAGSSEPGWVDLTVEDGGPGVPADSLAHLFDRFYRVPDATAGSRPGLGVGLSVVLGLATAMGGTATASNSPLGGLALRIRLRAGTPPGEPAP